MIPQDVVEVIPDVLRHRLVLTYDALADEISPETVINRILQTVALPQVNAIPQQGHSVPPGDARRSGCGQRSVTDVQERQRFDLPSLQRGQIR